MGIYDREYYRDGGGALRWFSGPAPATRTLIAINVAIYLVQILLPSLHVEEWLGATGSGIFRQFLVYQPFTAPFVHSPENIFHILWNMLFLWWFGSELEAMLGSREFTFFYLASAVLSTLGWAAVDTLFGQGGRMIGASGAVTAVAVVITLFFPNRKILLFFIIPMPLWAFLLLFLGNDAFALLQQLQGARGENVAFASHLTGALCGFLYKQSAIRLDRIAMPRFRPRLRVVVPERREPARPRASTTVTRVEAGRAGRETGSPPVVSQEQLEAQLDEVLAKIAREGRDALTDSERRVLEEASRRARIRRSSPS